MRSYICAFVLIFVGLVIADVPSTELSALTDLYGSLTVNSSWVNSSNWNSGDPCTNKWYGVTCSSDGTTVVKLNLYKNRLSGTIPASINNLQNITYLDFGSGLIDGTIPASLWELTKLQTLYLNDNYLEGSIGGVENLLNLRIFEVYDNNLEGTIPDAIGNLKNLTEFGLDENFFTGTIPSSLGTLPALYSIYLNNNLLSGSIPDSFASLPDPKYIKLQKNELTGSIPFTPATFNYSLVSLDISCNCFAYIPLWCSNTTCSPCLVGVCNTTTAIVDSSLASTVTTISATAGTAGTGTSGTTGAKVSTTSSGNSLNFSSNLISLGLFLVLLLNVLAMLSH